MEISVRELQAIVKTLPIGLYAKRGVKVDIGEKDGTSYYCPNTDAIVVSYPQVCTALAKTPDDSPYKERIIRGILYHEVSHAFMTPKMPWNDVVNVFEDERMETLLAKYYHDVDFKSNVYLFNGFEVGKVPPAVDKFTTFYNLVRFRSGKPELLKKVEEIIDTYKALTKATKHSGKIYEYYYAIMDLYGEIDEPENPQEQEQSYSGDVRPGDNNGGGEPSNTDAMTPGQGESAKQALDEDTIRNLMEEFFDSKTDLSLVSYFQTIIDGFNKRNKGGSAIGGYSGVLNPRAVNREDWKIFDRPFTQNSNNKYGTLHLNLFIDCSGSFYPSEQLVNQILSALSQVEKKNPNFTLDVVFCGYGERVVKTARERVINCRGGNDLDNDIYDIFRSLQKPNTYNYNIVLFDGDAFSNAGPRHRKNFKAFDFSNCTIISDRENERYIADTVNRAKVIYTRDYTDELLNNLKNVLARAFR